MTSASRSTMILLLIAAVWIGPVLAQDKAAEKTHTHTHTHTLKVTVLSVTALS